MARVESSAKSHPCGRCAKALGRSCCEVEEGQKLATLTLPDVERLSRAGWSPSRFSESEWLTDEEAREYEERRPLYRGYFRHGPRRWTLRARGGACVFWTPAAGCVLSAALRPTACLIYPFERVEADGETFALQVDRFGSVEAAKESPNAGCLAVEEARSEEELLAAFDTGWAELKQRFDQLRREVADHGRRVVTSGV